MTDKKKPVKKNKKNTKTRKSMTKRIIILVVSLVAVIGIGTEIFLISKTLGAQQAAVSSQTKKLNSEYSKEKLNKMDLPQLDKKIDSKKETKVIVDTSAGTMTFKVFNKLVPLGVENFLTHAKEGYYNGVQFFRVVKDFMIQTGDPDNNGTGGHSIWFEKDTNKDSGTGFKNEIVPELYHIYGALSYANSGSDSSNGSQFFIVSNKQDVTSSITSKDSYPNKILDAYKKGGTPQLDGSYTVFGQLIDGFDVLKTIQDAQVTNNLQGEQSLPVSPVIINSISVE